MARLEGFLLQCAVELTRYAYLDFGEACMLTLASSSCALPECSANTLSSLTAIGYDVVEQESGSSIAECSQK